MADSSRRREELWTCEACGEAREDSVIEVASETVIAHGAEWTRNVNHCSDREGCGVVARAIAEGWRDDFDPRPFATSRYVSDVIERLVAENPAPVGGPPVFTVARYGGTCAIWRGKPPWSRPWARAWYWMRGFDVIADERRLFPIE